MLYSGTTLFCWVKGTTQYRAEAVVKDCSNSMDSYTCDPQPVDQIYKAMAIVSGL